MSGAKQISITYFKNPGNLESLMEAEAEKGKTPSEQLERELSNNYILEYA